MGISAESKSFLCKYVETQFNKMFVWSNFKVWVILFLLFYLQRVSYHIGLSPHDSQKTRCLCMEIFTLTYINSSNDSFFLKFLISPENRNIKL